MLFPLKSPSRRRRAAQVSSASALERLEQRTLLSGTAGLSTSHDFSNTSDVEISSRNTSTITSTIDVTGVEGPISDLNVTVDIDHTNDNHLTLTLIAPDGTRIILADRVGGTGDDFSNTQFDDQASSSINNASAPFSGTFRPEESLAALNGFNANGTWTLEVQDSVRRRGGELRSWSLNITAETEETGGETGDGSTGGDTGGDTGGGNPGGDTTQVEVVSTFENTQDVNISSGSTNTQTSSIEVNGQSGLLSDLNVTIDIDHTAVRDLRITLIAPDGTQVRLADRTGGNSDDFSNTTFDDEAGVSIDSASAPFSGTFRPDESLSALDGIDPNGTWTLRVEDTRRRNGGAIRGWSMELTTLEDQPVDPPAPPTPTGTNGTVQFGSPSAHVGDTLTVTVNDADLDGQSQITVDVRSGTDVETLVLTAQGSGVFSGQIGTTAAAGSNQNGILNVTARESLSVIYQDSFNSTGGASQRTGYTNLLSNSATISLDQNNYTAGEAIQITLTDRDLTGLSTTQVRVQSGSDEEFVTLAAGGNGVFTGTLNTSQQSGANGDGTLNVTPGETITARFNDAKNINGFSTTVQDSASIDNVSNPPDPPASEFDIVVRFTDNNMSASQQAAFTDAANRWSEIIVGDLPDVMTSIGLVDDVVIDASAPYIDGAYNILGQAGPREVRSGSLIPAYGIMQFDSADLDIMESNGTLTAVIMHEMGHVLGLGTIWSYMGLVTGLGTSNPLYTGDAARAAYGQLLGTGPTDVPLENSGGTGTRDGHWRESIFDSEIMTGYAENGPMPISILTVAALQDMGYTVDMNAADSYTLPGQSSVQFESTGSSSGAGLFDEDGDHHNDHREEHAHYHFDHTEFTILPPSAFVSPQYRFRSWFAGLDMQYGEDVFDWVVQMQIG